MIGLSGWAARKICVRTKPRRRANWLCDAADLPEYVKSMFAFVTLIPLLALASLFVWFWRRRRARDPYRCWNCGMDLYGKPLHGDAKGRIRCPGAEMNWMNYRLLFANSRSIAAGRDRAAAFRVQNSLREAAAEPSGRISERHDLCRLWVAF